MQIKSQSPDHFKQTRTEQHMTESVQHLADDKPLFHHSDFIYFPPLSGGLHATGLVFLLRSADGVDSRSAQGLSDSEEVAPAQEIGSTYLCGSFIPFPRSSR